MKATLTIVGTVWLIGTAIGLTLLWSYAYGPGTPAMAPKRWPTESVVTFRPERPTLIMLAHPKCPCTRASLREIDRLMAQCPDELFVYVLFYRPGGAAPGWEHSDLWHHASRIPGVRVCVDKDGFEARRFGADISGQVLLYGRDGTLVFHGGITAGRGHSGDNDGLASIVSYAKGRPPKIETTPVYGCPLSADTCSSPSRSPDFPR
jgi:hypothetical protein